jgi:hypothetical protein
MDMYRQQERDEMWLKRQEESAAFKEWSAQEVCC